MSVIRQTSFAGGELAPDMQGRTDSPLYAKGTRTLQNFVVNRRGAAVSRDGFKKAWQAASAAEVRLIPFIHSSGESYVLELVHLSLRIYNARTFALIGTQATPWVDGKLSALQWAQFGNTLLFTSPHSEPYELTITTIVAFTPARFSPPGDVTGGAAIQAAFPSIGGNPPSMPVLVSWTGSTLFIADAAHPPRQWQYKVSTLMQHNVTGQVVESLPRDITQYVNGDVMTGSAPTAPGSAIDITATSPNNELVCFPDQPVYIEPGLGAGVTPYANWTPIANLYYRGRAGLFGFVGRSAVNQRFADFGDEPNYALPPLRGESPFRSASIIPGSGELEVSGTPEWPRACCFFAQRRALAGTGIRPATTWLSAVDQFTNYDEPVVNWKGQPLEISLLGDLRQEVSALAHLDFLFVLLSGSVWVVGRDSVPFDYDTFASVVRRVDKVGAWPIMPLVVDSTLLYPVITGAGIRALAVDSNGVSGADISYHAEHLFRPRQPANARHPIVRDWCFARDPHHTAWMVLGASGSNPESGQLVSVGHVGDSWAWARHITGPDDVVLSICSVPMPFNASRTFPLGTDLLFIAVRRADGNVYVERAWSRVGVPEPRYADAEDYAGNVIGQAQPNYPLDSYVEATITKATGTTVTGLDHLEGRSVWASCPGIDPSGPFVVSGGSITTPAEWGPEGATTFTAAVGLPFTCDLEVLDVPGIEQKNVTRVGWELDSAQGLQFGEDFDHLTPWQQRDVADSYLFPSPARVVAIVNVMSSWRYTGRAVLRQDVPLPVTVLGLYRELEKGG